MPGFFRGFRPLDARRNFASPIGPQSPLDSVHDIVSDLPRYSPDDIWARTSISLDVADRFTGLAIEEIKLRGVLEPLVLLPYRPNYDLIEAKRFVHRIFYEADALVSSEIQREIKLSDVFVIVSALKWVWARIPGGIVTWDVYELFKAGEEDAGRAQNAFKMIIPVAADSPARSRIIFNFFDLLSALASHWKTSGMGGRKVARLAAWWAFPLSEDMARLAAESDNVNGAFGGPQTRPTFSEGYKIWSKAADASAHLFFGYLRSQSASPTATLASISPLPIALSTLLSSTPYPPTTSNASSSTDALLLSAFVKSYSSSPRHILGRFHGLARRNPNVGDVSANDTAVEAFLYASQRSSTAGIDSFLTDEFTRILNKMCSYNSESNEKSASAGTAHVKPINSDASAYISRTSKKSNVLRSAQSMCSEEWAHFKDYGFWNDAVRDSPNSDTEAIERQPRTRNTSGSSKWSTESSNGPETPPAVNSWSQFMSRGFPTESSPMLSNPGLLLPSAELLFRAPPRRKHLPPRTVDGESDASIQQSLEIAKLPLDDAFWWTWLCAHGPEELSSRQSIFAAHVIVEFDAAVSEISNVLSDLKSKDRLVVFEERLSTKSILQDRTLSQVRAAHRRNNFRRLASRSFFHNRTESTVVVATAAAAAGVKLRDRPSLLSLYREYRSSNAAPGTRTVNVVSATSPGEDRVKRLREAVHAAASSSQTIRIKPDEEADRSWATTGEPRHALQEQWYEQARWKHHVSMVIEVEEEVSKALKWANSDRVEPMSPLQLPQPVRMLPTPPSSPSPRRISATIRVADVLQETSSPSPTISTFRNRRSSVHKRKKLTLKGSALLRREAASSDANVSPPPSATVPVPSGGSVVTTITDIAKDSVRNFGSGRVKGFMAKFMGRSGPKDDRTPSSESAVRPLPIDTSDIYNVPRRRRSPVWKELESCESVTKNEPMRPSVPDSEPEVEVPSTDISRSDVEISIPTSVEGLQLGICRKDEVLAESSISQKHQLPPSPVLTPATESGQFPQPATFKHETMPVEVPSPSREGALLARSSSLAQGSSSLAPKFGNPAPHPGMTKRIPAQGLSPRMPSQAQFPESSMMIQPIFPSAMSGPVLPSHRLGRRRPLAPGTPPPFPPPPVPHIDSRRAERLSQLLVQATGQETDMVPIHGVRSSVSKNIQSKNIQYSRRPSASAVIAPLATRSEYPPPGSPRWATITADARDRALKNQYQQQQQQTTQSFICPRPQPSPLLGTNLLLSPPLQFPVGERRHKQVPTFADSRNDRG
ncbi:uncharacterized protein V1513DRAFT_300636 [Lipomyces chichibuensis]|uniref:uncharacterized protein n=1 Tax=Lipomyces chichibuensis TaxID=1546026 RepID=UPI00334344BD